MKQNSKRTLTPKLRFPEFRDKVGWVQKPLGDVSEVLMCKRIFASETSQNGEVPFYKIGTLGGVPDAFIPKNLFEEYKSKYNFPRIGEVLLTCSGTIGKCLCYDGSDAYFQDSNIVWIDNPTLEVSNEFLLSVLSNVNWSTLNSTTITRIYGPDLRGLPIKFPQNKKEQKKIANCLSSLDGVIAAEGRNLAALHDHKHGLMQQLFPQPGHTQPRLRFPEFRNKGEWKTLPLGRVVEIASGQVDPTKSPYSDLPHIGGENIESHTGTIRDVKTAKELQLKSGKYAFDENDVLYSKIRPALNKVAAPDFKGICSADIYPIRPANRDLRRDYLFYLLLSDAFLKHAKKHSDRSKIPKVNRDALLECTVSIPRSAEQQHIADCLTALNTLITAQAAKIETLKQHKRGLMQQLFPAPEEV